jgi:hypothetical protein
MPDNFAKDGISADGTELGTVYTVLVKSGNSNAFTID